MTTIEPNVSPTALYEAKATCEALGITPSTLSRYYRSGYIKADVRRVNGRRVYKGSEIIKLWRIVY